jgi:hypothetical protein
MRPDDRSAFDDLMDSGMDLPFDAELETLDRELAAAGAQARLMLYGRSKPTRVFTNQLRARLLAGVAGQAIEVSAEGAAMMASLTQPEPASWPLPVREVPRAFRADETATTPEPSAAPARVVLALLAILAMAGVLALSALGGSFGPALP